MRGGGVCTSWCRAGFFGVFARESGLGLGLSFCVGVLNAKLGAGEGVGGTRELEISSGISLEPLCVV